MKKCVTILCLLVLLSSNTIQAQSAEAQQLLLNVEKLSQLKSILNNMYKGYEVISKGYNTIQDISQGNFKIHQVFLDALMQVSPIVKKYKRIGDILSCQSEIIKEYKGSLSRFKISNLFNTSELKYMENVNKNLFKNSLNNLNELALIITAGQLRMSDDERIKAIDRIYNNITDQLTFLRSFNNENNILVVQRKLELQETSVSKKLNGL